MAGFRERFLNNLRFLGAVIPTQLLINLSKQKLIIPVYHAISDEPIDHIRHLYPVKTIKDFTKDLDFLLKNYTPIDYFTLKDHILHGKKLAANSFLLTFDDGLREFHDVISAVLIQKGIPAICFLNSDFIDNKKIFFRHKASLLINSFSQNKSLEKNEKILNWIKSHSTERNNDLRKTILAIKYQSKISLDQLAQIANLNFDQYLFEKQPYLTSNQIVSLRNKGFCFGAHSCDHPEYQLLNLAEQIRQTKDSVEKVTAQFSLPYRTFSFPFTDHGVSREFFQSIYEKERIVDVSFGCAGLKRDSIRNHIQRIPLEISNLSAREIINTEYLYFLLKSIFRRNIIARN